MSLVNVAFPPSLGLKWWWAGPVSVYLGCWEPHILVPQVLIEVMSEAGVRARSGRVSVLKGA